MNEWRSVFIHENQIKHFTERAALIALPRNSEYGEYVCWVPNRLLKNAGGGYEMLYTAEFTFKLKKNGHGRFNNRIVIDEKTVNADEFAACFETHDEPIEKPLLHIPEPLEPEPVSVLEELIDDE